MNKKSLLNIIFKLSLLAISLSFIWVIEVFNSYFYIEKKIDLITDILNEDSQLFWRQKPNLNQLFQNAPIATDSEGFRIVPDAPNWESSSNRIMVLGASPSFGWGVDNNQNYTSLLQKKFNSITEFHNSVSFYNGSQVGFSSFQGLHLFEFELLKKKPSHILISYILNDVDYYRFFRNSNSNDKNLKEELDFLVWLRNFFRHLNTFRQIDHLLTEYSFNIDKIEFTFSNFEKQSVRVSSSEYEENIEKLVAISKKNNIQPILLKIPFGPAQNNFTEDTISVEKSIILNSVKNLYSSGYKTEALNKLEDLKRVRSYYIKKNSYFYGQIMEGVAKKNNVLFIDMTDSFKKETEYLYIDPIYDNIHPNIKGHEVISNHLFPKFKNILKFDLQNQ